jgi:hypothetical protein
MSRIQATMRAMNDIGGKITQAQGETTSLV